MTASRSPLARLTDSGPCGAAASLGLLVLRVGAGGLLIALHGWGKLTGFESMSETFMDPLGIGSPASLALAVFAEVFMAAALVLGLFSRLVAIPLIVNMAVAAFIVHADDPWATKEKALLYLVPFVALVFTGPGRFSIDAMLGRRKDA